MIGEVSLNLIEIIKKFELEIFFIKVYKFWFIQLNRRTEILKKGYHVKWDARP